MKINIITLFPEMFEGIFSESMLKRAQEKNLVEIELHNLRKWTHDNHRTVDDKPYGGMPGMVLKVEPIDRALEELKKDGTKVILLCPQGQKYLQKTAREISSIEHIILVCGHYEGYDERIRNLVDFEISVGDYILTCGEIPAMIVCDSIIRLIPGVLGKEACLNEESFENGILEYPHYTRPQEYKGQKVPEVLMCGDPKRIKKWCDEQALGRTRKRRPDLVNKKEYKEKKK